MSSSRPYVFSALAAVMTLALPLEAQSIVSTHSGVIHFFEGAVYLDGQPVESRLGRYPAMRQGSELRTEDGRAEVLLTPGVFLRMADHSSVQMISSDLGDTQVELRAGHVIVDSGEPNPDTSVTLIYSRWRVHLLQKGVYRMDSDPARLCVREGKAEAFASPANQPVTVEQGSSLPFADVLVADRTDPEPGDALSDWSKGRGESIVADNAITAQIDEDPVTQAAGGDAFTYYPMLGLIAPMAGMQSSVFSSIMPRQQGFNSLYLPGYTYLPYMFTAYGGGNIRSLYSPIRPISIGPGRYPVIGSGPRPPVLFVPRPPVQFVPHPPMRVGPVPAPHPGVHAVGHR